MSWLNPKRWFVFQKTPLQVFAGCLWSASEATGISLGKASPTVFGWMMGAKKKRVK